jgi:hypothetical protein
MNVLFSFRPGPAEGLNPNSEIDIESRVPAVGAPAIGTARKEIQQIHAVLKANVPGMAEPVES